MTTDVSPKEAAVRVTTPRGAWTIGGMVKGAGMIEPNLATMLGFLTTDAVVEPPVLDRALRAAAHETFNAISVDGEPSTNDTVFMLANGASGVSVDEDLYPAFVAGLRELCAGLAREIVRGGEGATKLATIRVVGAASDGEARRTARLIANSPLVKTALNGCDPNWGRLVAVAGRAGVAFDPDRTVVRIGRSRSTTARPSTPSGSPRRPRISPDPRSRSPSTWVRGAPAPAPCGRATSAPTTSTSTRTTVPKESVVEARVAPRPGRRPARAARRGSMRAACDRGATKRGGMHRRSNAAGVSPRAPRSLRRRSSRSQTPNAPVRARDRPARVRFAGADAAEPDRHEATREDGRE